MSSDEIEQLARQQAAMVRLCISRATRSDLADNPAQLQSELEIDNETLALLQALPERGLSAVATALVAKRRHAAARLIPAVVERLGGGFTRTFDEFASDHPPCGHPLHANDAIAFCEWLASSGSATHDWPPGFLKCQITLLFVNKDMYKCFGFVYNPAWGMSLGLPLPKCRCLWLQWGRRIWVVTRWRMIALQ